MRLRLATRGSRLAWTQSDSVAAALRRLGHEVDLVRVTTHGDITTAPLASLGGAGVFVGAVRAAVVDGEADFAVHSFKDLPTSEADHLMLAAVPPREDPMDALCARDGHTLATLPRGSKVGTGSPRRAAHLLAHRPDLEVVAIRGNVETRLNRVQEDLDAVVLAAAGLCRLGLADAITERLDLEGFLPAPAQGALAIECRSDAPSHLLAALRSLDDEETRLAASAERAVLARLEAGCAAPVGAHGRLKAGRVQLAASVTAVNGSARLVQYGEASATGPEAQALGFRVAEQLLKAGAMNLANLSAGKPKPLVGRTILAPQRLPAGSAEALEATGARVQRATFTDYETLPSDKLDAALTEQWDWLVVSSARTASALDSARLTGIRIAAVGPATASALAKVGIGTDLVATPGSGAALVDAFPDGPGRVLIPGAESHSDQPASGLVEKGWTVHSCAVYRTVPRPLSAALVRTWQEGGFDALVVTAGSVARAAVASAGLPGPKVIAIGEPSAKVAAQLGLEVAATALRPDAKGLVDATLAALA